MKKITYRHDLCQLCGLPALLVNDACRVCDPVTHAVYSPVIADARECGMEEGNIYVTQETAETTAHHPDRD